MDQYATDDLKERVLADEQDGWKLKGKLGLSFSLNQNANVVGTDDGVTLQIGGLLEANARYRSGPHKWENTLSLQETQTRTPQLGRFVKSLDQLDIQTTYSLRVSGIEGFGVFARAALNTQVFRGEIVATEDGLEVFRDRTGAAAVAAVDRATVEGDDFVNETSEANGGPLARGEDFKLTSPFEPLNLRQSVGLYADPVNRPELRLATKLGAGAQEILAFDGNVLVTTFEDDNGPIAIIRKLENAVVEIGVEAEIDARGEIIEKVWGYTLTFNAFFPPYSSSRVDRSFGDSISLRLKAGTSLKLNKIFALEYTLTVLRIPAVTTDVQVQNGVLISATFELI